jgi:hypothetical protein
MIDPPDDPSMILFRMVNRQLATREIALAMANMIFAEVYGDAEVKAQLPLNITDNGDRWAIVGSREVDETPGEGGPQLRDGRVVIEIVKRNCAVINLSLFASMVGP